MNVYFQEETYSKIKSLVAKREVSRFINKAVEEKIQKTEQEKKEELRQKLIAGYKKVASNKKIQEELAVWDETISDMWRKDDE